MIVGKNKLALYGGKPIRDSPLPAMYPGATFIGDEEIEMVNKVMKSQSLFRSYGPNFLNLTSSFEERFGNYLNLKYVLGVNAGTSALHCALRGIGVGPGDEVVVPAYGWVSCPAAVVACGAKPILANENQVKVLEDCAQAAGGSFKDAKLGTIGDVGTYSFQLNKMISAGEGGALATNNRYIYERALLAHDAGALYRKLDYSVEPLPGVNYRMTEITAAIMIEQLKKLDKIISLMRSHKRQIKEGISDISAIEFRELPDPEGDTAICLVFYLQETEKAQMFAKALNAENIYTVSGGYPPVIYHPESFDGHVFVHWKHILKEPAGFEQKYAQSLDILGRSVHLDISPLLTDDDINSIIDGIHKVEKALL
jgi:8-amino-3,8-dideoxy-alpha-D-manno-octulosonate transaminase